jgi:hypothetical protein
MGHKVGYAVVKKEHTIKKRILPQSAIIEAIQSLKNNRHEIVIITGSISTIMAAEKPHNNEKSKTQTIRNMLVHEGPRITL